MVERSTSELEGISNGRMYGILAVFVGMTALLVLALFLFRSVPLDTSDIEESGAGSERSYGLGNDIRLNNDTDPCLVCHESKGVMEGIRNDWENSGHAENNVTCIVCHEADTEDADAFAHNGYYISSVVTPKDCAVCHPRETEEFNRSLHSLGAEYYEYLFSKEKLPFIESQMEGGFVAVEGYDKSLNASESLPLDGNYIMLDGEEMIHAATIRGCQSCHGTNMTGEDPYDFTVWPNNGIGRINPDGSKGSCSACHSRHSFSVEEARKPETCGQCHMGPDHPQMEIYMESKHGNIYSTEGDSWNWSESDWEAGVDYRAPTCTSCHMSSAPGLSATHDVSARLSWELETPVSKHTDNTANGLGYEISDGSSWQEKRERMKTVCGQCHSSTWVDNYYQQADLAVLLYNEQYLDAKEVVDELYEDGLLTNTSFDEEIEFKIYEMWHHEGRRARMGAFMQGPDYVQWHGFYDLLEGKVEIEEMAEEIRSKEETRTSASEDKYDNTLLWLFPLLLIVILVLILLLKRRGKRRPSPGSAVRDRERE